MILASQPLGTCALESFEALRRQECRQITLLDNLVPLSQFALLTGT